MMSIETIRAHIKELETERDALYACNPIRPTTIVVPGVNPPHEKGIVAKCRHQVEYGVVGWIPECNIREAKPRDTTPLVHQLLPARSSLRTDWGIVGQYPMTENIFDTIEPCAN